jgi:hypothetical protein
MQNPRESILGLVIAMTTNAGALSVSFFSELEPPLRCLSLLIVIITGAITLYRLVKKQR